MSCLDSFFLVTFFSFLIFSTFTFIYCFFFPAPASIASLVSFTCQCCFSVKQSKEKVIDDTKVSSMMGRIEHQLSLLSSSSSSLSSSLSFLSTSWTTSKVSMSKCLVMHVECQVKQLAICLTARLYYKLSGER